MRQDSTPLPIFLFFSISIHLLILFFLFLYSPFMDRPLTGGGGHIEIVGLKPIKTSPSKSPNPQLTPPSTHQGQIDSEGKMGNVGKIESPSSGDFMGSGSGEDGENRLLAEIRAQIESVKRYPIRARKMKIEGTTSLQFQILTDGSVDGLTITESSGSTLLDNEALATIQRATPLPPYPRPLKLSIQFDLED